MPKQKLFRGLTGKHIDWSAVDDDDDARGDVDEVMAMAAITGSEFVDLRLDCDNVTCGTCKSEVDLLAHFTAILTYSHGVGVHSTTGARERRLRA